MLRNLNYVRNSDVAIRWLSLGKLIYVNMCNINVNKVVRVSLSEKSKGRNLKESIDFRVRTE